jgi:hypothetical protein
MQDAVRRLDRGGVLMVQNVMADADQPPGRKPLSPAAARALAEAEARRREADAQKKTAPKEFGGPKGPEPVRYGDWERKGIASDF